MYKFPAGKLNIEVMCCFILFIHMLSKHFLEKLQNLCSCCLFSGVVNLIYMIESTLLH